MPSPLGVNALGTTTVGSLQSGLYYGYLGLVDGILERLVAELGKGTKVVATGGLATLIASGSRSLPSGDGNQPRSFRAGDRPGVVTAPGPVPDQSEANLTHGGFLPLPCRPVVVDGNITEVPTPVGAHLIVSRCPEEL